MRLFAQLQENIIYRLTIFAAYSNPERFRLTDGQADCVRLLIDAFHEYNNTVRKRLSDEQYRVLGQILAEFLK